MREGITSIKLELTELIDSLLEKVINLDEYYDDWREDNTKSKEDLDKIKTQCLENWMFSLYNGTTVKLCLDKISETDHRLYEDITLLIFGLVELCQLESPEQTEERYNRVQGK